ncbi:MAG: small-conductance mechanosensitive channel [Rhodococcus sp. (in: high G+C Gram-positive bacteria)]
MSTFNGLPVHILLVHFIVVLAPLTAILAIGASIFQPLRNRLVWLIAALAVITLILTPLTTEAGEWLEERVPETAAVEIHAELGDSMTFFSLGLVVVAAALVFLHFRERRESTVPRWQSLVVVLLAVVIGAATMVQVYRIGDTGATASWSDFADSQVVQEDSEE